MESQQQKWVIASYAGAALLCGYFALAAARKLFESYDLETWIHNPDLVLPIFSMAIGALVFFLLWRNDRINQFTHEVVTELSRVTWPTSKDATSATFVVLIMVLLSALVLWLLDSIWIQVIQRIL